MLGDEICIVVDILAKDLFHDVFKTALIAKGWKITEDPLFLKVGGVDFFIERRKITCCRTRWGKDCCRN